MRLRARCAGLDKGASYRLERQRGRGATTPLWSEQIGAAGEHIERELTVEADQTSRFRCVPL